MSSAPRGGGFGGTGPFLAVCLLIGLVGFAIAILRNVGGW